jgi:hypothetical protein
MSEGYIIYLTVPNIKDKDFDEIKSLLKLSKSTAKYNVYTFKINDVLNEINKVIKDKDYFNSIKIYKDFKENGIAIGKVYLNGYYEDLLEYTFYKKNTPINIEDDNKFKRLIEYTKINAVAHYKDRERKYKMKEQKRKQFEEFLSHIKDKKLVELLDEEMKSSSYDYVTFHKQYKDDYYLVVHNSYFEDEGCENEDIDEAIHNHKPIIVTTHYVLYKVNKDNTPIIVHKQTF